jgi:hypothetical protein
LASFVKCGSEGFFPTSVVKNNILYEHSISNIEKITGAIRKENRIVRWSVGRQYGK